MTDLARILIFFIFILFSYFINRLLVRSRILMFILICILYFIIIFFYFVLLDTIYWKMVQNAIYTVDFGHADILLIELFFVCMFFAIINICIAIISRVISSE
jgi:hypothetical protein